MRKPSRVIFLLSTIFLFTAGCADTGFREFVYWNLYEVSRMNSTDSGIRSSPIEKPETYGQYMRDRRADLEEKEIHAPTKVQVTSE